MDAKSLVVVWADVVELAWVQVGWWRVEGVPLLLNCRIED